MAGWWASRAKTMRHLQLLGGAVMQFLLSLSRCVRILTVFTTLNYRLSKMINDIAAKVNTIKEKKTTSNIHYLSFLCYFVLGKMK
jgi:hypothetical protein